MDSKVKIENLSYCVPSREFLNDITLRAEKDKFVGLIGPNGSGKTSLLKHIYRALPALEPERPKPTRLKKLRMKHKT